MRPVTKRYREKATGLSEEKYDATRMHILRGGKIAALGIPFAIAGFIKHEPFLLNGIAALISVGTPIATFYLVRRNERERDEKMMLLLRQEAAEQNVTAREELHPYIEEDRGTFGS